MKLVEKIIDKYFMRKIAKRLIEQAKMLMYIDLYYIELKDKIEIYANYADEKNRLQHARKICSIDKESILSFLTDFEYCNDEFRSRLDKILKC